MSGYQYRVLDGNRIVKSDWFPGSYGSDRSGVVTGLTNGREYEFQVRAMTRGPATRYIQWVGGPWTRTLDAKPEGPPPDHCIQTLAGDGSVTGRWVLNYDNINKRYVPECPSFSPSDRSDRSDYAARYYRFTVPAGAEREVTLEVSASTGFRLYRWEGHSPQSDERTERPSSNNTRMVRRLGAGKYTVEVTTAVRLFPREAEEFTLTARGLGSRAPVPSQPTGVVAEVGDRQVTLRWDAMNSVTRWQYERDGNGVWIDAGVGSDTGHTVTDLANGATYRFRLRAVNDRGNGQPSDWVSVTLPAATAPGQMPSESRCIQRLSGDGTVTGRWAAGCDSMERSGSYARYYEFTLSERREVTLHLQSGTDPYLYLRSGAQQRSGRAIEYDNDDGQGARLPHPAYAGAWHLHH